MKLSLTLSVIVGIFLYYGITIYSEMHETLPLEKKEASLLFSKGSTIKTLANQLLERGLLKNKNHFLIWGKLNAQETKLQAGEYLLTPELSLAGLLNNIAKGKVIQQRIALIEGHTFRQILQTIQKNPLVNKQLKNLSDEEIMSALGYKGEHPEGRFYPDTYYVTHGVSDIELLSRAYTEMERVLEQEWQQREKNLPLKSAYEALILASIVEKESAIAEERPRIAGLFINRLRKKMRLQTDPTVIYGIENYDGNIRFRDLRKDTPYNTYTRHGLPPTPIALPGREAIHATLHPDKTEYLYFVAYSDGSGRHVFSTNLKDHERAVDKYQRHKKSKKKPK